MRSVRRVELDELARESDVLFVLAPGGQDTRHVVNGDFLREMKEHAVLVNAARGTLVDSDALAQALREGWIWGAGLDVVEGEPQIGADHPLVREPRYVYAIPFSEMAFFFFFPSFVSSSEKVSLMTLIVLSLLWCRCVIVPHIGSATFETRLGMVNLAAGNALAGIDEVAMPAELDAASRIAP